MPQSFEVFAKKNLPKRIIDTKLVLIPKVDYYVTDSVDCLSPSGSKPLVVMGGEGTLWLALKFLLENGRFNTPIGLIAGGTGNVLHNQLQEVGQKASLEQFYQDADKIAQSGQAFHPGQVAGETTTFFTNHVGFGPFEIENSKHSERLRSFVGKRRGLIAPFLAIASIFFNQNGNTSQLLDIYSVLPTMSNIPVFPGQEVFDNKVTRVSIDADDQRLRNAIKLLKTLYLWKKGLVVPSTILKVMSQELFEVTIDQEEVWIDGDIKNYSPNGSQPVISRSPIGFHITALE